MRQTLLRTSAIALVAGFATSAQSAEWEVKVGGYMEQYVAYANSDVDAAVLTGTAAAYGTASLDGDYNGIDSKQDAEIHFLPSITLDNGLKIGADVQLEANTSSDQIDESSMYIDFDYGRIVLGSEASAGYLMSYAAPDVTFLNVNSGSTTAFVPWSGSGAGADIFLSTLGSTYIENLGNDNAQRFTYFTPRFAGFQVGLSYARDGNQDSNSQIDCDSNNCDFFDIGANYVNSFGDFDVALSGRYGVANAPSGSNPDIWAVGLNLGYAGFTIGGSYAEQNDAGVMDGHSYDAGVSYYTGPWGFSFTYFHGENVDNDCTSAATTGAGFGCAGGNDENVDQYLLGASYSLAEGVDLNAFGAYVDFEGARLSNGEASVKSEIDGWILGTGIKISF